MFVNVSPGSSGIFTSQMKTDDQIPFVPDLVEFSIQDCITAASNIPIDVNNGKFVLPKTYGFLDMFDVGNVNQLNIIILARLKLFLLLWFLINYTFLCHT